MQNFRRKTRGVIEMISMRKTAACMLSVAIAAVIFWVFTLTGNTDNESRQMTVAESIRAAGDRLTASADTNKFTGRPSSLTGVFLETSYGQSSKVSEIANELADSYIDWEDLMAEEIRGEGETFSEEYDEKEEIYLGGARGVVLKEKRVVEVQEVIEPPVEAIETSLLRPGQEKVIQTGVPGLKTVVYEQMVIDGEVRAQKEISKDVLKKAVREIKLVGSYGVAVSPLDFGIELDENGVPKEYSRVLTNQRATGYNAGVGAWGASGMDLSAGYVAVRPQEIPYGTRMYITSPDNSFVYGFAIAADTGVSLMANGIDVDLYYDSYLESCLNGRRNVNIYILD